MVHSEWLATRRAVAGNMLHQSSFFVIMTRKFVVPTPEHMVGVHCDWKRHFRAKFSFVQEMPHMPPISLRKKPCRGYRDAMLSGFSYSSISAYDRKLPHTSSFSGRLISGFVEYFAEPVEMGRWQSVTSSKRNGLLLCYAMLQLPFKLVDQCPNPLSPCL